VTHIPLLTKLVYISPKGKKVTFFTSFFGFVYQATPMLIYTAYCY